MVIGLLVVALPITVLGGAFASEVQRYEASRDQALQKEKTKYKFFLARQVQKCHPVRSAAQCNTARYARCPNLLDSHSKLIVHSSSSLVSTGFNQAFADCAEI
jgi:hypothetical protein